MTSTKTKIEGKNTYARKSVMSFRSPETLKKEYALQAERTVRMNLALQTHSYIDGSTYKETLEDLAVFANEVRKVAYEMRGQIEILQNIRSGE